MKYIIVLAVVFAALIPAAVEAKEKPLPYTIDAPRITQQKTGGVQIAWYNTTPGTYRIWAKNETCRKNICTLTIRLVWKKYIGIGNVRVNDRKPALSYSIR